MDVDSQATDIRDGVAVAEGAEPATAGGTPAPQARSLKQRLAAIREEAFGIGKDNIKMKSKAGVEFTIRGHTVEAVLSEIRPLFSKHGVDIWPNLVERTYSGNRCDILVDFTFERTDESDEQRVIRWAGAGTDDGDKGFSKAGTNALKEMLKKTFLITDRDDAKEEEEKVEHRTDSDVGRERAEQARAKAEKTLQRWASTFKSALESARTLDDIKALERENRPQMTADDLPAVTREFFVELIARRKREFENA